MDKGISELRVFQSISSDEHAKIKLKINKSYEIRSDLYVFPLTMIKINTTLV